MMGAARQWPLILAALIALGACETTGVAKKGSADGGFDTESASDAVSAIGNGGEAVADLGRAAGVELWLPVHSQMRDIAASLGGTLKPTGAGGGDLALAAFTSAEDASRFRELLKDEGIHCPNLGPDLLGVRLQSQPSKVRE